MRKLVLFGIIVCFSFCTSNQHVYQKPPRYDSIEIQANLSDQLAFSLLDDDEHFKFNKIGNPVKQKKSCNVFVVSIDDTRDKFMPSVYSDCEAEIINDTLRIDIGNHTGFGGSGIHISVVSGRFNVQPYSYSDVIGINETERHFDIENQKLIMSKRR